MPTLTTNILTGPVTQKPTCQLLLYDFNSYCDWNGKKLACDDNGVYVIEGTNYNGSMIESYFEPIITDFGYTGRKRIRYLYFHFDCAGSISLAIYVDDEFIRTLTVSGKNDTQYIRVSPGRDCAGIHFKFQIRNVASVPFRFRTMEAEVEMLAPGF